MNTRGALTLFATILAAPATLAAGGKRLAPPPLSVEHRHPSGAFTFRTPEGWTVAPAANDALEAWGGELGVRFVYREGENGYDALHAICILEGLAPGPETEPRLKYEYEFHSGVVAERRVLDTAHSVRYDRAVRGHRDWRQRTVTVVGGGASLCVMSYAPAGTWKKVGSARAVLDAVVGSLSFPPGRPPAPPPQP